MLRNSVSKRSTNMSALENKLGIKLAGLSKAIEWIALNDDPSETNVQAVSEQLTVQLVADLFRVHEVRVARAVLAERQRRAR